MAKSLRAHQKQVARELILQAFADEIVERGVADTSLQAVADRAGMSHRTLYNYFESREALIEALLTKFNEASSVPGIPGSMNDFDRVPDAIHHYFTTWSALGNLAMAVAQLEMARIASGGDAAVRTGDPHSDLIRDAVTAARPDLDPEVANAVAQAMRLFGSTRTWYRMTVEQGVPASLAAETAVWGWSTLRAALEQTEGAYPLPREER